MEVVQRTGGDSPFGRRDVEEWSRLDELTGMLEHARVQTDQWAGIDAQGGSHKYGKKVVDASKTGEKGQHLQRQQLEVFQSKVAGGALQMVKSQTSAAWSAHGSRTTGTSTTVSSRTRWSSRSQATADATLEQPAITDNFANLELQINPIDVSTLKMKASVGRSGAIGSRRPPSARSRRLSASKSGRADKETDESENNQEDSLEANKSRSLTFDELKNSLKLGELLGRRLSKSSSTDDLPIGDPGRDSDDSGSWRRGARVRRSLQFSTKEDGGTFAPVIATKRHSFVTVESLRDVRSRLKHFDPIDVDDYSGPKSIILKNDEQQINSSSGLVRAIEQSTKMASSTTNFGSASGKTDTDWHITPIEPQSLTDKNRTFVTLNENHSKDMLSPTKKRFNESFAFFRSSMVSESQSPTLRKTSSPARQNLITIPIIFQQDLSVKEAERKRFSLRGMIDAESSTQDSESLGWVSKRQLDGLAPLKRRSWAGDSTLFGNHREDDRTTSLTSTTVEMEETSHSFSNTQVKKNKRVEFCKTEVHFAAESGKFNIVETDEKPPPSNNFRRRRRSHPVTNTTTENPPQVAQKPPLPELRFGDTTYEKEMLTIGVETKTNHSEITEKLNVKIAAIENKSESEGKQIFATTINRPTDLEIRPRASSINETTVISKSSVALRFQPPTEISKSSPNSTLDSNAGPMELQKLIKSLRPTPVQRRSVDFTQSLHITEEEPLQFSVPERIRYLEDRKTKGFSTTVNVGGTTVVRNSESIWLQGSGEMENNAEVAKESAAKDKLVHTGTAFKIPTKDKTAAENRLAAPPSINFEPILRGHGSNGVLISPSLIMQIDKLKKDSPTTLLKPFMPISSSNSTPTTPVISHFTSLRQLRQMNEEASDDGEDCDAADREVCSLMSPNEPPMPPPRRMNKNTSTSPSVASGSWSKMRVVRLSQKFHKFQGVGEQNAPSLLNETVAMKNGYVRGAINLDALNEPRSLINRDEKKDVVETSSNRSPPQISPSKIVAPIAPANPRICNGNAAANSGSSITSISLSYQSSQPKILASINAPAKPLAKKEHEPTKIVAPIPVKCTRPIKYPSDNNKVETNKPTCPRLEKMSAFQASKVESKYSSLSKKEGSPVRLGDITAPRSLSPAKSKFSTRTSSPAMRKKKPEFYFGAEVLEVEPRPSDDRRRLDDSEEEDVERPVRKREPSPSKSVPSKTDFGQRRSSTKEKTSTTALIEELTRAADEILQAVNGYDDSAPSSDEDAPRPVTLLPALKEGEVNNEKISKVSSSTTTRTTCSRLRKSNIGRTSSNSSVESTSHEANTTPRSLRTRKTTTNGTRTSKLTELSTPTSRRQRVPRKRSDSLNSSKGDEEEAEIAKERLRMSKSRRSANSTSVQESSKVSKTSSESVVKSDLSKVRAPVERIIPPANRKGTVRGKKEDMFHSNRVINGATAERRLQLLESSCSGSGLRSDSSPGMKRYQHRTVRNAPLKVSAK
ncbi:uncharacterized protein LOC132201728 isoform X1 [Neocloeon triangulifer]|uniref:uncharacterized protein LOC132201728 isoform X1 n=1 Tax=Neocloeon triangulifer TaxID=2078957 RepID=UPI00286EF421|nr:uncharacterized protein LOC132201728 isoform X1 [Neocloeon triangulifer]XP_059484133.1 uncharacterized protein LOC132201728 isoform X1 [Neocloeon triangulifer]